MTLLEQINKRWTEARGEELSGSSARKLVVQNDSLKKASGKFNEWSPIYVYVSMHSAMQPKISFSLRYKGQEIATLRVKQESIHLTISEKQCQANRKYFGVNINTTTGPVGWQSAEAAEFRRAFKSVPLELNGRSAERRIESKFLRHMSAGKIDKFSGKVPNIQPVLFAGCPFQFPLPLSGNTGVPEATKGSIDILARRGVGGGTRLSVWEIKRPGITAQAIEQAYIYCVTLLKMIRGEHGQHWYEDVAGFKKLPERITIESVVAVSLEGADRQSAFLKKLRDFKGNNALAVGPDTIRLFVAFYDETSTGHQADSLEILSFQEV